jgi:thiamine kinase-like enzyme
VNLCEAAQAVAFEHFQRGGIGPKLHSVFKGGRIEQFVPSRMSDWRDARAEGGLKTIAQLTARMHSLDIPIAKNPDVFAATFTQRLKNSTAARAKADLSGHKESVRKNLQTLLDYDSIGAFVEVDSLLKSIKSRSVLTHFDHHANNIIVKEGSKVPFTEKDMLIVDMDVVTYYYRGADIGCFLLESSFDYSNILTLDFVGEQPEASWREFIEAYLCKWKELNQDIYDPAIDSVENLLIESRLLAIGFNLEIMNNFFDRSCESSQTASAMEGILDDFVKIRIPLVEKLRGYANEQLEKAEAIV